MDVSAETTKTAPTTHPQYRQIALIIYGGVLLIGAFEFFSRRPPSSLLAIRPERGFVLFCIAIILLSLLELLRPKTRPLAHSHPAIHLVLMLVLSGLALSVVHYDYAQLLLLTVILFAELTFSRRMTALIILVSFSLLVVRMAFGSRRDMSLLLDTSNLLIFIVLVLLTWTMARLIKSEWSNRLDLQSLNGELTETSTQLTQMAVVNERNRLARDIHDSVGHHLAALNIQLSMAAKLHEHDSASSLDAILEAQLVTKDVLQDVRRSVGALRQSDDNFALVPAIELLIGRISNDQLAISYNLEGDEALCPTPARIVFFRAVQEGLTNIYKHATASHVNLWLQFLPQKARLRIVDDGVGFDTQLRAEGSGLRGLRERIEALGGTVAIESHPNEGTVLDIILPQPAL